MAVIVYSEKLSLLWNAEYEAYDEFGSTMEDIAVYQSLPVRTRPGISAEQLLSTVTQRELELRNLQGSSPGSTKFDELNAYVAWANETVRQLGPQLSETDLNRLVQTKRHWVLQEIDPVTNIDLRALVQLEIGARVAAFAELKQQISRFNERWGAVRHVIIPDTNYLLYAEDVFTRISWRAVLDVDNSVPLALAFPIMVIDELDEYKRTDARSNARMTLRQVAHLIEGPHQVNPSNVTTDISYRILLDQPGHIRLRDADMEIIDACETLANLSGAHVHLVTRDVGMTVRASAQGVSFRLFEKPESLPKWDSRNWVAPT